MKAKLIPGNISITRSSRIPGLLRPLVDATPFRSADLSAYSEIPIRRSREINASLNNYDGVLGYAAGEMTGLRVAVTHTSTRRGRGARDNESASVRARAYMHTRCNIRVRYDERRKGGPSRPPEIRLIILSIWTASLPERGRSRRVTWLRALERRRRPRRYTPDFISRTYRASSLVTPDWHAHFYSVDSNKCRTRINMTATFLQLASFIAI